MDLKKEILKEHSKAQTDRIVRYVGNDAGRFNSLVEVFLAGPYRISQRAAWPLGYCAVKNPELVRPHLGKLLKNLERTDIHDSVKRNTIRLLQFIEIPRRLQGLAAEICFRFLLDQREPVAVRCFSLTVLANLAEKELGLKNEIVAILEDSLPYASAGFRSRAMRVMRQFKK